MKYLFLFREAFQALRGSLLRSFLTVIGIVVGIFSVTAMLALGAGLTSNVLDRFSSFAQGDISISGDITFADFDWMKAQPYVQTILGTQTIRDVTVVANNEDFKPTIQTVVGDYKTVTKFTLQNGDTFDFTDRDFNEYSAVVSNGFADRVLADTKQPIFGQSIVVGGQKYTVVGVIESSSMTFTRGDGLVLLPYNTVVGNLTESKSLASVSILLKDATQFEIAGKHILEMLNASRQLAPDSKDVFTVETSQAFIESAQQTTQMLSLFLGIVGGIALFVGGIGTMNMMLTTVTERTREIGLRKAVGARDSDILLQILIESVMLTSLGGLIGILLSLGAAKVANQIFASSEIIKVIVNVNVIVWAACVSFAVGIIFGLYPARNASRLQPVDALRAE